MPKLNMVKAINLALMQEMEQDERVLVMGEDVGRDGGVFRVTEGLIDKYGQERVIDTPLAESGIIGSAVGMALAGLRPVAEMQFSGFSYLIIPQLENHASRFRSRTHGLLQVPLVVRMPYGMGVRALEHHSESRETFYAHQAGLKVVMPSGPRNARALLVSAIRDLDPVVFMEPKRLYRAFREEVPEEPESMEIGRAVKAMEGNDVTVIAWGAMFQVARKACETLAENEGLSIDLIDLLTVSPFDTEMILESVRKTGRAVIVQEAPRNLGLASEIIARINDYALLYLEAPVSRVTGFDVVTPYFGREHLFMPSEETVSRAIVDTLNF
jgi:pyruvate dehydrogenase E1 component beta subunit